MKAMQPSANRSRRKAVRPRDPDLLGADAALKRAARRALKLELQTDTPCWIMRDGKLVDLAAEVRHESRAKFGGSAGQPESRVNRRKPASRKVTGLDVIAIERAWRAFQRTLGIRSIYTATQYERTLRFMDALLNVVGSNERHPLAGLLHLVGDLVWNYEARTLPWPDA